MIIDTHAHVYAYQDWGRLAEALDRYGIDRIYLSNPDELGGFYPSTNQIDRQNRIVCDFVRQNPKKARYMCYVNPALDSTIDTLKKAVDEDDAKGIKLWVATTCDSPQVNKVAEFAIDHDLPILTHFTNTICSWRMNPPVSMWQLWQAGIRRQNSSWHIWAETLTTV